MNTSLNTQHLEQRGNLTERAGLSTGPVPLTPYCSPDFFEKEKKLIFERAWLLICREEELPLPGSFVVKDIPPTSVSALITRSNNGNIQAFHNTCSHRGSQVVYETEGQRSRFVCPYHRWTYTNDGELLGVPDQLNFFDIDKEKCGLSKIHTEVWEGWVFINLAKKLEVSLAEYLGDFAPYFEGFEYVGAENPIVIEAELNANWKVLSDAFIETYHIASIHPGTLANAFCSPENPFGRLLDAAVYGPHRTVSMYGNPNYKIDPKSRVELFAAGLGGTDNVSMYGNPNNTIDSRIRGELASLEEAENNMSSATKPETLKYPIHPAVNPTASDSWSMDVNQVFPHVQIDSGANGFWAHWFWPIAPDRSRYEGRFYMSKPKDFTTRLMHELYISRLITAITEDVTSMQKTQKGIESGGKEFMNLQDSEVAIRHHIEQCIKWVESDCVREALA